MRKHSLQLLVFSLSLSALFGKLPGAQCAEAATISLSEAIREGWANSPQIRGQEVQSSLASGDRWRRFIINEPQIVLTNADDSTELSYGLTLNVAFPGKAFAFTKSDSARAAQQYAELIGKKQDLAKTLTQAYLDCSENQALSQIQKENIQDLSTVQSSLKYLYESGHSSQSDTIQADLQLRQAQSDLVALDDRAAVSCQKLVEVLKTSGVGEQIDTSLPDDLDPGLLSELGSVSGDVRRADAALQIADSNLSLSWWNQIPDLALSAQRNHYLFIPGSPNGQEWTSTFSVAMTIPILFPFHETVEARRSASQAHIDESTAALQLAQAKADVMDGAREYRRSKARLMELRKKDLSLAEALRDSVLSAYRSGKVGFADLVLARKTYSDLKAQDIQLRASIVNARLRCLNECEQKR